MRFVRLAIVCLAVWGFTATSASAVVITFAGGDGLFTSYSEGGFTFTRVSGTRTGITIFEGDPAPSLSLGLGTAPVVGDRVDITLDGGGLFTFDSFDYATGNAASDTNNFFGEVNSVVTEQLLGISSASTTFVTTDPGFSGPIDRLRIEVSAVGTSLLLFDNLVLNPVIPAPAALPAGLIGLGALAMRRRRRVA